MNRQSITQRKDKIDVVLMVAIFKEDKYYVAYCPALDLSSYGLSAKEATKSFSEMLNLFFKETKRKGTLERLLLKYGWTLKQTEFRPPETTASTISGLQKYPNVTFRDEKYKIAYA
jgi:hypothetical protein